MPGQGEAPRAPNLRRTALGPCSSRAAAEKPPATAPSRSPKWIDDAIGHPCRTSPRRTPSSPARRELGPAQAQIGTAETRIWPCSRARACAPVPMAPSVSQTPPRRPKRQIYCGRRPAEHRPRRCPSSHHGRRIRAEETRGRRPGDLAPPRAARRPGRRTAAVEDPRARGMETRRRRLPHGLWPAATPGGGEGAWSGRRVGCGRGFGSPGPLPWERRGRP
jgi:hypothetical protein